MKIGSLVIHSLENNCNYTEIFAGTGIVIFMWDNEKETFDDVPLHDPEDVMVMFECGERMVKNSDLKVIESR